LSNFPGGAYSLSGFGAGSYTVTPSKTTGQNNITSFDAGRIALHVAGQPNPQLNATQLIVADVSGNGTVTSFDAGEIANYVVSFAPAGMTGTWKFTPINRTYASIGAGASGQDFAALLMGEVSGNWNNTGARAAIGGGPTKATTINAPRLVTKVGDEIVVPVEVQGIANKGIISYEFDLRYDPSVIQPATNPVDLAGTVSRGLSIAVNAKEPGLLRVAVYGPVAISSSGVLLNLRFTAVGTAGSISPLTWERIMLNEGSPFLTTTDGQIDLF
jgi:hypothetical protein